MNRYWHILFFCFFILGCHGQQTKTAAIEEQNDKDPESGILDEPLIIEEASSKEFPGNQVTAADTVSIKKVKKNVPKNTVIKEPETQQRRFANIWTDEQITFLNNVEKILFFEVKVTDIGSRKLELNSQLNQMEHEAFIQVLLNTENYPGPALTETSNGKKFVPNYQMLLELGDEKLTLMFDVDGLNMMVANLYGREKHPVALSLMNHVENLKK